MARSPGTRAAFTTVLVLAITCSSEGAEPAPPSLQQSAMEAFVADDLGKFEKHLLTENRVRAWAKEEGIRLPEAELNAEIKSRAEHAAAKAKRSFRQIRDILVVSGFDWTKAELIEVRTIVSEGNETKRVLYDPAMKEQKLDLLLYIKQGEKKIVLKLDDCILIEGRRYVGDGFYLKEWAGFQLVEPKEST